MANDKFLFVVSGAAGTGKDSVVKALREAHPEIEKTVSATTRAPRPGEQEGVDYYYRTREQFQQLLELLAGAVVVVHTLLLAGARGACGGRDGLFDFGVCLAQCLDHAVLAGAGCAGNYKQKFIIRHEMFLPPLMLYPPARRRGLPPFRAEGRTARHDRSP